MASVDPKTGKPVVSSAGKFLGVNTIYGRDGEHGTPYMTRVWFWGLRLHIFHRPDLDEDCHDHPWDFTTIPLWPIHGYVEEVVEPTDWSEYWLGGRRYNVVTDSPEGKHYADISQPIYRKSLQIVPAFRPSFRPATHCHRVLGAYTGQMVADLGASTEGKIVDYPQCDPNRKIVTIVWRGKAERTWGFLKNREGKWCWVGWKDYVFNGGKDGPCQ